MEEVVRCTGLTPAITEVSYPSSQTLFQDDFEDVSYSKSAWSVETGTWEIKDGNYICFLTTCLSLASDLTWSDYIFTVDMMGEGIVDKIIFFPIYW